MLPDQSPNIFTLRRGTQELALPNACFKRIVWRRAAAFFFDMLILIAMFISLMILNVATFFALSGLLTFLWPAMLFMLYDTLLIGGRGSATIGMRLMGLKTLTRAGGEPGYFQAFALSILFYLSVTLTSGLLLLIALFNNRGRCLHDILTGIFIVNAAPYNTKSE